MDSLDARRAMRHLCRANQILAFGAPDEGPSKKTSIQAQEVENQLGPDTQGTHAQLKLGEKGTPDQVKNMIVRKIPMSRRGTICQVLSKLQACEEYRLLGPRLSWFMKSVMNP